MYTSAISPPEIKANTHTHTDNRQEFQIPLNYSHPHIYNTSPDLEKSAFIFNLDKKTPDEIWMTLSFPVVVLPIAVFSPRRP